MKRLRIILLIAVIILAVAALVLSFNSCTAEALEPPPPYSNCAEFVEYARSGDMYLLPTQEDIDEGIWETVNTGFDTTYVAYVKTSAPAVMALQHPILYTKKIELGVYCDTNKYYREVIPGFKTSAVVFAHLRSWESNPNISIVCDTVTLEPFLKIPPIPNEDHSWCQNDYSNWTLVTANINCMCPYTPAEDPLDILCQWRQ